MAKNKSILQDTKECYLCRMEAEKMGYFGRLPDTGLDKHHFIHGNANRQHAERYGLYAYMCRERHHVYGPEAPHQNPEVDLMLKRIAQQAFEDIYGHDKYMEIFQKNFL